VRHLTHRLPAVLLLLGLGVLLACGGADSGSPSPANADSGDATPAPAGETAVKQTQPKVISQGERVELAAHATAGRTTVFDFTSEYCGPCRQISPYLDKLHESRDDLAVVKVDINRPGQRGIDWGSPVARQFGLQSIPHMKVYSPEGALIAEGQPAWEMVVGWINEVLQAERAQSGSM